MHARGVGEHAVEVEQAGAGPVGKAEHGAQPTDSMFPARLALWINARTSDARGAVLGGATCRADPRRLSPAGRRSGSLSRPSPSRSPTRTTQPAPARSAVTVTVPPPRARLDPLLHHRAHRVEHPARRHRQGVQPLVDDDLHLQPRPEPGLFELQVGPHRGELVAERAGRARPGRSAARFRSANPSSSSRARAGSVRIRAAMVFSAL